MAKNKKYLDDVNLSYLENDTECIKKIYSPCVKLKSIDPRSPTVDFVRTPIVVPEGEAPLPLKLHNKNLDNVRKSLLQSSITKQIKKKLPAKATPPKLLESNVIAMKPVENKRKSYVGLLETNLDFIETDLDKVKTNLEDGFSLDLYKDEGENDNVVEEPNLPEEVFEQCCTPQRNINSPECVENICLNDVIDPRSPTREFFRTPVAHIIEKVEVLQMKETNINSVCDENDDGLIITSSIELPTKSDNQSDKTESLKDFNQKLTNLIYEDEEESQTVIRSKKVEDGQSRTPLRTRNTNTTVNKGISKLKVHDKPRKSKKDFSKIPVFQNRKGRGKITQQCENTPPASLNDRKTGKQHWDANNTLVI